MKSLLLLVIGMGMVGMSACAKPSVRGPAKLVAGTWADTSFSNNYQRRVLVCDATQEILGTIRSEYDDTHWAVSFSAPALGKPSYYTDSLSKEYTNEDSARSAAEEFLAQHLICRRQP